MVESIQGTGSNVNHVLYPLNQKNGELKTNAGVQVDYTVSFQKETFATLTYNRNATIDTNEVDETGLTDLRKLITQLFERQGITWESAMAGEPVEIDPQTQAEAKALIAEDGYWGVEQTSERIFQLAIANAGEDSQKIDQIKFAVDKGFDMAKEALGGTLPDISLKTYEAVMDKLDKWASSQTR